MRQKRKRSYWISEARAKEGRRDVSVASKGEDSMKLNQIVLPPLSRFNGSVLKNYSTIPLLLEYAIRLKSKEGEQLKSALMEMAGVSNLLEFKIRVPQFESEITLMSLAMWFAWCRETYDSETAITYLSRLVEHKTLELSHCVWLLGLEVPSKISLHRGFSLIPIDDMPWSFMKDRFLKTPGQFPLFGSPICKSALVITKNVPLSASDDLVEKLKNEQECEFEAMKEIVRIMNSLEETFCIPYVAESYITPPHPLGPFCTSQGGGTWFVSDIRSHRNSTFDPSHKDTVNELWNKISTLEEAKKRIISLSLDRIAVAKARNSLVDRLLELGISLEAVLLEESDREQVRQTFSLRGSWLIANSGEERLEIYNLLKELYDLRSQAAHNGQIRKKCVKAAKSKWPVFIKLAERILHTIIERGIPDWNSLVLNVGENRDKSQ